jgi:hypothetical protein
MAIAWTELPAFPGELRSALRTVDRRIRFVGATRGAGTTAAVLAIGAALGMVADFVFVLPSAARWAIWFAWLCASGWALSITVVRPLLRRIGWTDLAAVAEEKQPRLGERLTSAVALLDAREHAHGSRALIGALADDAVSRTRDLDLADGIGWQGAGRRFALGATALLLVIAPSVFRPDPFAAIAKRFLMPWADIERIGRFVVVVRPGDALVARGDDLAIAADVRARFGAAEAPDQASLEWTDSTGSRHRAPMIAKSDATSRGARTWQLTMPRIADTFNYRVVSGTARSQSHRVTAVDSPSVVTLRAVVDPPAYTKLPSTAMRDPARIEAWEGSTVLLTITANKPLRSAELGWPNAEDHPQSSASKQASTFLAGKPKSTNDGKSWTLSAAAEASGTYTLRLTDEHDLRNRPEPIRRVVVRPDVAPTVALGGTADSLESSPDDILALDLSARDDFGVAVAEIHYAIARRGSSDEPETGFQPAKLPGLGTRVAKGEATLDLKPLHLRPGDAVSYSVKVADNRPAPKGPNVTWTLVRRLTIVDKVDSMLARRSAAERAQLQETLNALKKSAAENRQAAEQLRYAADAVQRGNGRWDEERQQSLSQREAAAREMVDRLQLFSNELEDHPQFAPLARPAKQIADVEAEAGREMLDQARRAPDASRRLEDLKQADARLAAVQTRLDEFQHKFDTLARLEDDRRRLQELAVRQEDLAARAAELANHPAQRAELDQVQAEQSRLNRELDEMMRRSPELKADVLAAQAKQAAALAEKARELARRQRDEARDASDLTRHDATLRALAEAQRALEDDARRLALKVDTPLAENGRARVNVDALAQAVEPLQRGQIESGTQRLEGAEVELRRLARDLEDVRDDPKALARRLAQRQETVKNQVAEVIRENVQDPNKMAPEEQAALKERLKPLADREEAIARLAAAITPPKDQRDAAKNAVERTQRALEAIRSAKATETDPRQNEARDAFNHLANVLPDANQRHERSRQVVNEARGRTDHVTREVERHLRETGPQPGRPFDPERAAAELADRLAPLAQQQGEVAADLAAADVEGRLEPQRARAARRARELADALAHARRDALPALAADARAATERLEQKFNGREPADDLATELAGEMAELRDRKAPPAAKAADARRLASAIRNVQAPDAPIPQAEAAREAERAVQALPGSGADFEKTLQRAAEAAENFARHLADTQTPQQQAAGLARAQRALEGAEAPRDPQTMARAQRTIAEGVARIEPTGTNAASQAVKRALELADQAALPNPNDVPPPTPQALSAARAHAAESLEAFAAVAPPKDEKPHPPATANARAAAAELARQQRALADQIQAVHERTEQAADKNAARAQLADALAPLAERQQALADAARNLNDPIVDRDPRRDAERRRSAAEVSQGRAADAMTRRDPSRAANLAREAAGTLEQLAQALPETPPDAPPAAAALPEDPNLGLRPAHADEARALVRRERQIRERLQAVLGERVQPQREIRNDAVALGREVSALRDQAREHSPRSHGPASAAADLLLNHAPPAMDQGADHLAQGRPDPAREAQRRAAETLERAAQQAEDLAGALRADRPLEAADAPPAHEGELAAAREAQQEASRQLSQARDQAHGQQASQAATAAMRQAARGLRSAAQHASRGRPSANDSQSLAQESSADPAHGDSHSAPKDPKSQAAGTTDADLAEIQRQIRAKTGRSWGELPGHLRTEILNMSQGRYRDDYARLIQLYFQEIAKP